MKFIVGNYKMCCTVRESVALAHGVTRGLRGADVLPTIVLCPSFPALAEMHKALARTRIALGAQDVAPYAAGAWTGEVSAAQLADVGCTYVIVGHEERRHAFAETDAMIREKLLCALEERLIPILCVETLEQLNVLPGLSGKGQTMIAYEPAKAVGTGAAVAPGEVVEMHKKIRAAAKEAGHDHVTVLYGGSVDHDNAYDYLREPEIDGLLVGSASIRLSDFLGIIDHAKDVLVRQSPL